MARELCSHCEKTLKTCLCGWLTSIVNPHPIAILQHPSEAKHSLGTAKIANLSLKHCELWQGEDFQKDKLVQSWFRRYQSKCYVIFPGVNAKPLTHLIARTNAEPSPAIDLAFIFIDGTWKKARKIWYLNPWLQNLPQLTLQPIEKSQYRIRKSPFKQSLSTIEAIAQTLGVIEQNNSKYQPLLTTFEKMIDNQIKLMGEETYHHHYDAT